jgi:hypothetical protein
MVTESNQKNILGPPGPANHQDVLNIMFNIYSQSRNIKHLWTVGGEGAVGHVMTMQVVGLAEPADSPQNPVLHVWATLQIFLHIWPENFVIFDNCLRKLAVYM